MFLCVGIVAQVKTILVHFDFNQYKIPDSSKILLRTMMHEHTYRSAIIEGHCDSAGTETYNQTLSMHRAEAVASFLIENGMPKDRILEQTGYGKQHPLNENKTEQDRWMNRRVLIQLNEEMILPQTISSSQPLKFDQLKAGETFVMEHVLFEPGRHILKEESYPELQKVWQLMMDHPSVEMEIQGHVCCISNEPDGFDQDTGEQNLSEARALAIYNYLIQNGIDDYRLSYAGFGGSKKINLDEETEEKRRVNRRVEFKIVRK